MPRTVWIILTGKLVVDLAAQVADVHVDDVGEAVVVHVPDVFHDHGAAERAAAVAHQVFQDAEFLGSQLDVFVGARHLAADAIEQQVAHLQPFRHGLAAAQARPHASQQFDKRKRLHQIIVGAQFQAFYAIVDGIARAQDQDRRAGLAVANLLQHRKAVHVGKHQVQNDEVILSAMNQIDGGGAVAGDIDGVARAFQTTGQEVLNAFFVLDNQYSHRLAACRIALRRAIFIKPPRGNSMTGEASHSREQP